MQDMSTSQSPPAKERNYKIIKTIGSLRSITESMGARRKQSKFETNIIYNEKSLNPVMEVPSQKNIDSRYKANEAMEKLQENAVARIQMIEN